MSVARLGYLHLATRDPAAWRAFGTDVLGLMDAPREHAADSVFLRADDHPFRLMIDAGEDDRLLAAGWEMDSAGDYEAALARLEAAGAPVTRGDADGARKRSVSEYARSRDPAGNGLELYHGRLMGDTAFESPLGVSRFVTGEMGLGHVVVPAPAMDETLAFYRDHLGFGLSDTLTLPPPAEGAPDMKLYFMHAANPRHHSLALFNLPVPTGVVHLMFEVPSVDEVGACLDRVQAAGIPLMATLGRHCNDNMLSFYAVGPGGIAVEYGCEGLQIDPATFEPTVSTQADIWGHAYQPMG